MSLLFEDLPPRIKVAHQKPAILPLSAHPAKRCYTGAFPRIGSLCTGYGGLDIAAQRVFGGELAWWSDIEPGPIAVMNHHHPDAPNIGNLKTADWSTVDPIDILTAGYPCQPFSNAGKRGDYTQDPRHLWPHVAGAVGALRPRLVILENVAAHLRRGFDVVLQGLAEIGYDTAWCVVRASDVGAPHRRERLFVVAQDVDQQPRLEWRSAASGQTQGGRSWPDARGRSLCADSAANTVGTGFPVGCSNDCYELATIERSGNGTAPNTQGVGRREGRPEHAGFLGQSDAASGGESVDWREYQPAIRQWERTIMVPAPFPSACGARGGVKVSPAFGEWMMGVPGRITSVPDLSINERLKLIGNGVVPQQAELGIQTNLESLRLATEYISQL